MIECPWCKSTVFGDEPNCAYCRKPLDGTPPPAPIAAASTASTSSTATSGRWRMDADMGGDPVGSVVLNPHDDAAWSATNTAARPEVVREVTWQRPEVPELELEVEPPPPRRKRQATAELGTPAKLPNVPDLDAERGVRNRIKEEEALARSRAREQERAEARQAKMDALAAPLPPEVGRADQKNGWAILSAVVPGLGQMIKGDVRKGYGGLLVMFVAYALNWMPVVVAIWIWTVYDAYTADKPASPR